MMTAVFRWLGFDSFGLGLGGGLLFAGVLGGAVNVTLHICERLALTQAAKRRFNSR